MPWSHESSFTSFLLLITKIVLAQVSFTSVGDNLVIANYGITVSYPKEAFSTFVNSQYLEAKMTTGLCLSLRTTPQLRLRLQRHILICKSTCGNAECYRWRHRSYRSGYADRQKNGLGSNTFTNFPFVVLTGNQTVAGNKTFSGGTALTGTLTAGNILSSSDNTVALGSSSLRWSAVFSPQFVNTRVTAYRTTNAASAMHLTTLAQSKLTIG